MKIVKFRDGSYGIRRDLEDHYKEDYPHIKYEFLDLTYFRSTGCFNWKFISSAKDCRMEDLTEVKNLLNNIDDFGEVIE